MTDKPNPGSDDAIKQGCTCPVKDNAHGRGIVVGEEYRFWVEDECPMHGEKQMSIGRERMNLVRENLMTLVGYSPYCGADHCRLRMPRTQFNGEQFECSCGWVSSFDPAFIADYKAHWSVQSPSKGDGE